MTMGSVANQGHENAARPHQPLQELDQVSPTIFMPTEVVKDLRVGH